MLPHERQLRIVELIRASGTVSISQLTQLFDVSPMTIRRDLHRLAEKSLLEQTYGGATVLRSTAYEPPFISREEERAEQKRAIGKQAADLVKDGDTIALDVGTTTLELARQLRNRCSLVVLTSSMRIALELAGNEAIRVILAGGIVRPGELSVVGDVAVNTFAGFFVDKAFLGAAAICLEHGVSDYSVEDTGVKKAMIARAKETILLADGAKFGKVAFAQVCPISALSAVVTDAAADPSYVAQIQRLGAHVIVSSPVDPGSAPRRGRLAASDRVRG